MDFRHAKLANMQNNREVSVGGNGIDSDVTISMARVDGKNLFFVSYYSCVDYERRDLLKSVTYASIAAATRALQS